MFQPFGGGAISVPEVVAPEKKKTRDVLIMILVAAVETAATILILVMTVNKTWFAGTVNNCSEEDAAWGVCEMSLSGPVLLIGEVIVSFVVWYVATTVILKQVLRRRKHKALADAVIAGTTTTTTTIGGQ